MKSKSTFAKQTARTLVLIASQGVSDFKTKEKSEMKTKSTFATPGEETTS